MCCLPVGVGNPYCWDGEFTQERCCGKPPTCGELWHASSVSYGQKSALAATGPGALPTLGALRHACGKERFVHVKFSLTGDHDAPLLPPRSAWLCVPAACCAHCCIRETVPARLPREEIRRKRVLRGVLVLGLLLNMSFDFGFGFDVCAL